MTGVADCVMREDCVAAADASATAVGCWLDPIPQPVIAINISAIIELGMTIDFVCILQPLQWASIL